MKSNYKQNLHVHSSFCDGKNSPEDIVLAALEKGFDSIGFSSHSPSLGFPKLGSSLVDAEGYQKEIKRLKDKYDNQIKIFLGIETDESYIPDLNNYEYVIRSLHYLKMDDGYEAFDRRSEVVKSLIDRRFNGSGLEFSREYYRQLSKMKPIHKNEILGHFDIITKNIEILPFVDLNSKEYLSCAFSAIEALKGKFEVFEVNTGAIARGYRTSPYPTLPILKELNRRSFKPIITTDCHNQIYLDDNMDMALSLLKEAGFKERQVLTEKGFEPIKI